MENEKFEEMRLKVKDGYEVEQISIKFVAFTSICVIKCEIKVIGFKFAKCHAY